MKGLKFFDKIIFFVNSLAALLLLLSYALPYVSPKSFAILSVLSLAVPLLIILNILFFIYWLLKVRKQMVLSFLVLIFGYKYINSIYRLSDSKQVDDIENISIISYNIRVFNKFHWLPNKTAKEDIINFIKGEKPDIISLQEYPRGERVTIEGYHNFNATYNKITRSGQVIYSKFPIINSGSLDFPNTFNNGIFVDIVKKKDTIRIYNIHLQSSGINTEVEALKKETSENLFKRVGSTFKAQEIQMELLLKHKVKCKYKTIITGDFNNTAYSYVYKKIKGDAKDAFIEAGNGFGRTFDFKFFPVRIDFILPDSDFTVNGFKTYDIKLSDHYPIKAILKLH